MEVENSGECINNYYIKNGDVKETHEFKYESFNNGISIYEVIRIIDETPLFFEDHIKRLINSFKISNMNMWIDEKKIKDEIIRLNKINNVTFGNIKLIFNFNNEKKDYFIFFIKHNYPKDIEYDNGVKTITYIGERKTPNAKIIDNNFRSKVNEEIRKASAYEAMLVDRSGNITEGSKSNLFFIKGNEIITSKVKDVLPGVTRKEIINLCSRINIHVVERDVSKDELKDFDAAFISGTSPKVLPIRSVDNVIMYSIRNNVLINIKNEFDKMINTYIENHSIKQNA